MRNVRLILACGLILSCCGCHNDDVDRLARIWYCVGKRLHVVTGGVRAKLSRGWTAFQEQSNCSAVLRERVLSRLHLDKLLASSDIDVEVSGTTVTLRGQAPEAAARRRAVELAEGTVGVEKVDDEMEPKE